MKLKISDENYSSPENLSFKEAKFFEAENYKAKENVKYSFEKEESPETFEETKAKEKTIKKSKSSSKIQELVQRVSESSTMVASVSATAVVGVIGATTIGILPNVLENDASLPFEMDTSLIVTNSSPALLDVQIPISNVKDNSNYTIKIDQYDRDNAFLASEDANFGIEENAYLLLTCPLNYGISTYKIRISYGGKEDFVSEAIYVDVSQEYLASYLPLSGKDVEVTINEDLTYDVKLETGFNSDYPNIYSYKVEMYSNNLLLDSYKGSDPVVTFSNISLEEHSSFSFVYYDLGTFNKKEHIYQQFDTSTGGYGRISIPQMTFDEPIFSDDIYFLPCTYTPSNDEEDVTLEFEFVREDGTVITFEETGINESLMISLERLGDNPGIVSLKTKMSFLDGQNNRKRQSISLPERRFDLSYTLDVTTIIADVDDVSNIAIPLHLTFDVKAPSTYNIRVLDALGNVISNSPAENGEIQVDGISNDGGEITIGLYQKEGELILQKEPISILSLNEGSSLKPTDSYLNNPNPNDAYVTYNDDGTLNIYRDMYNMDKLKTDGLDAPPTNIYYDAYIYHAEYLDSGDTIKSNEFHNLSRERISKIEDIPTDTYIFEYGLLVENNGIMYKVYKETPSGTISKLDVSSFVVTSSYDSSIDKTRVVIETSSMAYIDTYIYLEDGTRYEFDSVEGAYMLNGNNIGKEIEFYASPYSNNKKEIPSLISVKGKDFLAYNTTLI